jgi:hypothetical protein
MAFFAWDSLRGPTLLNDTVTVCAACHVSTTWPALVYYTSLEYCTLVTSGLQKLDSGSKSWMQKGKPLMQRGLSAGFQSMKTASITCSDTAPRRCRQRMPYRL